MITRNHLDRASTEILGFGYDKLVVENALELAKVVALQEIAENLSLIHDELKERNRG